MHLLLIFEKPLIMNYRDLILLKYFINENNKKKLIRRSLLKCLTVFSTVFLWHFEIHVKNCKS